MDRKWIHLNSISFLAVLIYLCGELFTISYSGEEKWQKLKAYNGVDIYFGIGDVATPRDINPDPQLLTSRASEISFDSAIISSTLTKNGEVWTWLPKSVGRSIYVIDKKEGKRYEKEILKGTNFWKDSLNKHKVYKISEESNYFKQTGMREIYVISLFKATESKSLIRKKEAIKSGISQQIKSIFEKSIARTDNVYSVAIPALSATYGTLDSKNFLTYSESWSSILDGISKTKDFGGISSIYFVVWDELQRDKKHLKIAIEGFFTAYNEFTKTLLFPLYLVYLSLIASQFFAQRGCLYYCLFQR
ncbi:MAG: hypothetical protein HRU40_21910 [Saprospiraceae bacterium]|nr:hypothetical protein [Saprospiraceae bacterium]